MGWPKIQMKDGVPGIDACYFSAANASAGIQPSEEGSQVERFRRISSGSAGTGPNCELPPSHGEPHVGLGRDRRRARKPIE